MITGQTGLIYKGSDGTGRIIKPDEYQPKGNYAAADHNHNGVYQPVGSYAAANHSHNGANLSFDSTRSINDVINNNYSMIVNANNEISSLKSSVSSGKAQIASAITDKGVSTAASASFSQMASNIRNINAMPSLLGTWKFNDILQFTTSNYFNNFPRDSVTYTFTSYDTTRTGIQLEIGFYQEAYIVKCYTGPSTSMTIYNSTYNNKWYNSSQYITITSVKKLDYIDVEKWALAMLLPFATKV